MGVALDRLDAEVVGETSKDVDHGLAVVGRTPPSSLRRSSSRCDERVRPIDRVPVPPSRAPSSRDGDGAGRQVLEAGADGPAAEAQPHLVVPRDRRLEVVDGEQLEAGDHAVPHDDHAEKVMLDRTAGRVHVEIS